MSMASSAGTIWEHVRSVYVAVGEGDGGIYSMRVGAFPVYRGKPTSFGRYWGSMSKQKELFFWAAFSRPKGLTTFSKFQDSAGMGKKTETVRVRAR